MSDNLLRLVRSFGSPHILVLGDVVLDRYTWGDAERVSQEAPVILLRVDEREYRLGGAANVSNMLQALGARASLAGVIGADRDGELIRQVAEKGVGSL